MPGLNGKGPRGEGSRTGRGRGKCTTDSDASVLDVGTAIPTYGYRNGNVQRGGNRMRCRSFQNASGELQP